MSTAASSADAPRPSDVVDASTPAVRDVLTEMVRIVLAAGGSLHPGLRLLERDGDMTVLCPLSAADGEPDKRPLFDVPRELLIPVDGAVWADHRTQLRLIAAPPGLTPLQAEVLDLHIELYNAAGKIPWLVSSHPRAALADQPAMVEAIQGLRPGFGQVWTQPARTFLSTRTFGLSERPEDTPEGAPQATPEQTFEPKATSEPKAKTSVIMPLIDLLNHHPRGAGYDVDDRAISTEVVRPTGTEECFATYGGRRDIIDLATQYGFADRSTRFAHCAAVSVPVAGVGVVEVRGHRIRPPSPLDPPRIRRTDDGLVLSHLTFTANRPERFEVPLRMAVQGAALQGGLAPAAAAQAADDAIAAIAEANFALLDAIVAAGRAPDMPSANAALVLMADAAEAQADIVRSVVSG